MAGRRRGAKQIDHLYEQITSFKALRQATLRAVKGKRKVPGAAAFMADMEMKCLALERALKTRTWRPGGYVAFWVNDPKPRRISAAPFAARVVHHALCHVVEPIFERGFIEDTYANRKGFGTHACIRRYEHFRSRSRFVLRADIFRYFPAIDHEILKQDLRRRIKCADTLWLLDSIIDGSNAQEPVHKYYPGDDLLTPLSRRRGLPIGNLTSQFFANVFLDRFDHFTLEVLKPRGYVRYVDDCALFANEPAELVEYRNRMVDFLAKRRLSLHPKKTHIISTRRPTVFLGYELWPSGLRRLPVDNVSRFRHRMRSMNDRMRIGTISNANVRCRIDSWVAHAKQAHTVGLRSKLLGVPDGIWGSSQ